eukprot:1389476-Amorphochlora_amoeboformis.AAC.1
MLSLVSRWNNKANRTEDSSPIRHTLNPEDRLGEATQKIEDIRWDVKCGCPPTSLRSSSIVWYSPCLEAFDRPDVALSFMSLMRRFPRGSRIWGRKGSKPRELRRYQSAIWVEATEPGK